MFNYDPWSPQMRSMMSQMATQNNPQMPLPQPQEFLKTLPQCQGMDLSNLTEASKNLCKSKGIDYETAKQSVSNEINTISKER